MVSSARVPAGPEIAEIFLGQVRTWFTNTSPSGPNVYRKHDHQPVVFPCFSMVFHGLPQLPSPSPPPVAQAAPNRPNRCSSHAKCKSPARRCGPLGDAVGLIDGY